MSCLIHHHYLWQISLVNPGVINSCRKSQNNFHIQLLCSSVRVEMDIKFYVRMRNDRAARALASSQNAPRGILEHAQWRPLQLVATVIYVFSLALAV